MDSSLKKTTKSLKCPNCGASIPEDSVRCSFCSSVVSITACPSCFGPIFKGMKYCPACGTAVERSEPDSSRKLKCPRCDEQLVVADLAGTKLRECHICGGIWLTREVFEMICSDNEKQEAVLVYPVQPGATELKKSSQPSKFYVPCPECENLMNRRNFSGCSGTIVDVCKDHGVWLDRQELQKIIHFIRNGGLQKARDMELTRLKDEQKRLEDMKRQNASGYAPFQSPKNEENPMDAMFTIIDVIRTFFRD